MTETKKMPEQFNDAWLTRALKAQVNAEPRPALEERILARLAAGEEVQKQTLSWKWLAAPAALATLLIVLAGHEFFRTKPILPASDIVRSRNTLPPQGSNDLVRDGVRSHSLIATATRPAHRYKSVPRVAQTSGPPKQQHFPSDTAATEQEKILEDLARKRSQSLLQYARKFAPLDNLEIRENFITPLSIQDVELQAIPNE